MRPWWMLGVALAGCGGSAAADDPRDATAPLTADAADAPADAPADVLPGAAGDVPGDVAGDAPGDAQPDAPAPVSCAGRSGVAGQFDRTVRVGGQARTFHLHAGTGYRGTRPAMLVLNFHGFTSNGAQEELYTGMDAVADTRGFLVAYPDGVMSSWNAGACCGAAMSSHLDDVAVVRAVIDAVAAEFCVDPARVFATGMSNGGFMSHRLACELSDRIAAIAPVAGVLGIPECHPTRAVPVFAFHGTLDPLVPYNGGGVTGFASVPDTLRGWAQRDGCDATSQEFLRMGMVHCDRWPGCRDGAEVQLCTVDGGGHTWPGSALPILALGLTTQDISATTMMVDFFERHPLR